MFYIISDKIEQNTNLKIYKPQKKNSINKGQFQYIIQSFNVYFLTFASSFLTDLQIPKFDPPPPPKKIKIKHSLMKDLMKILCYLTSTVR